jgi:ubiquinone biosynthesis protein Coq4
MDGKEFLESRKVKNIVLGISIEKGVIDLATLLELYKEQLLIQRVVSSATECRHDSQQKKLNFLKWNEFAEKEIADGRKQIQCSKCKKWYFPSEL